MHPLLQALVMAARGHTGLPPQLHMPGPAGQAGPPMAAQAAASASGGGPGANTDRQVATTAEQQLLQAAQQADDPQLKAVLSGALAAIHKYLAADQKEQHAALGGKLSPRLMAQSYGR